MPGDSIEDLAVALREEYKGDSLMRNALEGVTDWIGNLNLLQGFVEFSDDKLDYGAAFLDMITNYDEHKDTQTLARSIIERAMGEI